MKTLHLRLFLALLLCALFVVRAVKACVAVLRFVSGLLLSPHADWPMVVGGGVVIVLWQLGLI